MCAHVCVRMWGGVCSYVYVCVWVYVCGCTRVCVCLRLYVYAYVCGYVYVRVCLRTYVCVWVSVCVCTRVCVPVVVVFVVLGLRWCQSEERRLVSERGPFIGATDNSNTTTFVDGSYLPVPRSTIYSHWDDVGPEDRPPVLSPGTALSPEESRLWTSLFFYWFRLVKIYFVCYTDMYLTAFPS